MFMYVAEESEIDLSTANYSHLVQLKELVILPYLYKDTRVMHINGSGDHIFENLNSLTKLSLNVEWIFEEQLPELFKCLENLTVLDLSRTNRIDYEKLVTSFVPFKNVSKCKLEALNFWNIQSMVYAGENVFFHLETVLVSFVKCPISYLNLGYNAIQTVYAGINKYTPHLKYLDLSNNMFGGPLITSSFSRYTIENPCWP